MGRKLHDPPPKKLTKGATNRPRQEVAKRGEQLLKAYKKAFAGFSDEEILILDGVILE